MATSRQPTFILNWRNDRIKNQIADGKPISWPDVFARKAPLDLEIGIGNGSFLVPFAEAHPERNIVGIDIEAEFVVKADRKLSRLGLTNARLLIGDAKLYLYKLFADRGVENLYIHFPDPWFKKRHKKRRLINPVFLKLAARRISGKVRVATDDEEYRDWVVEAMSGASCFDSGPAWLDQPASDYFPTKYEKKWRSEGKPVYYMDFEKRVDPILDEEEYIDSQNLRYPLSKIVSTFTVKP